MIFYKIPERPDEDCTTVIRSVLTNNLKIDHEDVEQFKFCGVHRLGKQKSRSTKTYNSSVHMLKRP